MASPRKFSEKIALHTQKQAEETAAFEQIMREVGTATRGEYEKQHLHISQSLGSYRGGSLPNVNQIGNNSIDLQSALNCLEDIKQGREILADRMYNNRDSRTRHVGPHRRPFEKRVDCSPYGSPYLSPPPDSSWRRTNSDSALHQSATIPSDNYHGSTTPPANRRNTLIEDGLLVSDGISIKGCWDPKKQLIDARPRSCEVPGINIYPTEQDQNVVHISIANNTGSLPDLTNLQFQSPLATPLDTEDQTGVPYNTSSQQSPSSLSPTSLTPAIPIPRGSSSVSSGGGSLGGPGPTQAGCSPGPPQPQRRRPNHPLLTNLIISGSAAQQNNCLRVPSLQTRYLQTCKGVAADTGKLPTDSYVTSHSQQPSSQQYHIYSQQPQSLGVSSTTDVNTARMSYRSTSPAENSSYSAPQSPVSQTFSPVSSPGLGPPSKDTFSEPGGYYIHSNAQTNALQEHFRQFNMIDTPPVSSVDNIFLSDANNLQYSQVHSGNLVDGRDILDGTSYYSGLVQDQYSRLNQSGVLTSPCGGQNHSTTPQTPQTPSSIPNIVLTDFSSCPNSDDQLCRHDFVKDIGSVMVDSFDSDLFVPDDLKAGLDPIDLDGFHMLTDSDIVTDAATENSFRLDRL